MQAGPKDSIESIYSWAESMLIGCASWEWTYTWGTIYNMLYMFTLPQEIRFEALDFYKKKHPEAAWDILKYGLCGEMDKTSYLWRYK